LEVKSDPAGRLCDLLQAAKAKHDNTKVRAVWASVFGVEESDTGAILRMLSDLIQISYKTKDRILQLENIEHSLYLKPFQNIERLFSQINLEAQWQASKRCLDEPTIYGLKFCSDQLSRELGISKIEHSEIEALQNAVNELTEEVLKLDFEPSLKAILVRNLESLRAALLAYRIKGIEGIETELELSYGSLILNKKKVSEAASESTKKKNFLAKYLPFLEGINKTVNTAKNIDQASGNALSKILGLESG
jgi:hypothetical protein